MKDYDRNHPTKFIEENYNDITYIKSADEHTYIYGIWGKNIIEIRHRLNTIIEKLKEKNIPNLLKININAYINSQHDYEIVRKAKGKGGIVYFKNGDFTDVSNSYWKAVEDDYNNKKNNGSLFNFIQLEDITNFRDGIARVFHNGKYGFISPTKVLIEPEYDKAIYLGSGMIRIKVGDKFGIIDITKKNISSFDFQDMRGLHGERIAVKKENKWGFLGKEKNRGDMKIVIPCIYDKVRDFEHGLSIAVYNSLQMLIDSEGRFITLLAPELVSQCDSNPQYTSLSEILAHCYYHNKKRTIKEIVGEDQIRISNLKEFNIDYSNEIYHYPNSELYYYIGKDPWEPKDNLRLTLKIYNDAGDEKIECQGFTDENENLIIDLRKNEDACLFIKGKARVKKDGKWGMIDRSGKLVIPYEYDSIGDFMNVTKDLKLAIVSKGNKWGAIDEDGEEIVKIKYGFVYNFSEQRACVLTDNAEKCGFVNEKGAEVIPLDYEYRFQNPKFENGLVNVSLDGELFWINKDGERSHIITPSSDSL